MTCCCCLQEAFTTAKLAFANYKMRIRSNLASTHLGPETLEEAVQDYINRNTDLYDLPALVNVSRVTSLSTSCVATCMYVSTCRTWFARSTATRASCFRAK